MAKNYFIEIIDGITSITFSANPEFIEVIDAINEAFKIDQTHLRLCMGCKCRFGFKQ